MRGYICLNIKRHHSINLGFFAGVDNSRLFTAQVNWQLGQAENYFPALGTRYTCLTWPNPALSLNTAAGRGQYETRVDCTVNVYHLTFQITSR